MRINKLQKEWEKKAFLVFDRNRLFPENLEKFSISFNLILLQSFGFFNSQGFIFLQTKFPPNLLKPIQWGSNGNPPFRSSQIERLDTPECLQKSALTHSTLQNRELETIFNKMENTFDFYEIM